MLRKKKVVQYGWWHNGYGLERIRKICPLFNERLYQMEQLPWFAEWHPEILSILIWLCNPDIFAMLVFAPNQKLFA